MMQTAFRQTCHAVPRVTLHSPIPLFTRASRDIAMVKTENKTNKTASIAIASSLLPTIGYMIKLLDVGRIEQIDFLVYVSSIVLSAVFFYRLIFKKTMLSTHNAVRCAKIGCAFAHHFMEIPFETR
jgi:hypothetical protein